MLLYAGCSVTVAVHLRSGRDLPAGRPKAVLDSGPVLEPIGESRKGAGPRTAPSEQLAATKVETGLRLFIPLSPACFPLRELQSLKGPALWPEDGHSSFSPQLPVLPEWWCVLGVIWSF